jgi:hypothetical protein
MQKEVMRQLDELANIHRVAIFDNTFVDQSIGALNESSLMAEPDLSILVPSKPESFYQMIRE